MQFFKILMMMLEKVKKNKYRDDVYENKILKTGSDIDREERDLINSILFFEIEQQYSYP